MSIRRATTAFMTKVAANPAGCSLVALTPPSQMNSSSPSLVQGAAVGTAINAGALTIAGQGQGPMWLVIPSASLRALLAGPGVDVSTFPSEALQLSQECACNLGAGWDAVFAAAPFSFTTFTPTAAVPTMCC